MEGRVPLPQLTVCPPHSVTPLPSPLSAAQAISQMEGRVPLPQLFMRTVIVAVRGAPKLRSFVRELLSRLVSKQVRGGEGAIGESNV